MKKNFISRGLFVSLSLLLSTTVITSSCNNFDNDTLTESSEYQIRLTHAGNLSSESVSRVDMLLFDNSNSAASVLTDMTSSNDLYTVSLDKSKVSKLLVLGNHADASIALSALQGKSYNELLQLTTTPVDYATTFPAMHYTAELITTSITAATVDIELLRSLSRIDVKVTPGADIQIQSCEIKNLADRSSWLHGNPLTPTAAQLKTATFTGADFATMPNGLKEGLVYIHESKGVAPRATFVVTMQGVETKLQAELPQNIERNKKYEVSINHDGVTIYANISIKEWEDGGSTEAHPMPL